MRTLTILLPDLVDDLVSAEASKRNVNAAALCSGLIAEHFLRRPSDPVVVPNKSSPKSEVTPRILFDRTRTSAPFDVQQQFPGYPRRSIELAQQVVDEALLIPNTEASRTHGRNGRSGIAFAPNFVFIEYLQKREPGGIMVSFYGPPHSHGAGMKRGQGNYSRVKILRANEVPRILPEIILAHKLKFG